MIRTIALLAALPLLAFAQDSTFRIGGGVVPPKAESLPPGEGARVEGIVRDTNGQPIARAALRILPGPNTDGTPITSLPQIITGASNDDGAFVLDNIAPGANYRIAVQRQGYANTVYGQRRSNQNGIPITLTRGQVMKDVAIEMTQQAVITGRITDINGDPVPNAQVMLMRRSFLNGAPRLQATLSAQSNDLGEFRAANIAPGTYFLRVQDRPQPGLAESNVPTFYPNGDTERSARTITVAPGDEVRGINVQLRRGRMFSISGTVVGADGKPAGNVPVLALPDNNELLQGVSINSTRPDGVFSIQNVAAGTYIVQTLPGNNTPLVARQSVTITDKNIADLVLQASPGSTVRGTMRVEGSDLKTLLGSAKPNIVLTNIGTLSYSRSGTLKDDGSFEITALAPGTPNLNITALPESVYVKQLKMNGEDITHSKLNIAGDATLEILLSTKAAAIVGAAGAPAGTLVTLWTAESDPGQPNQGYRTAITNQNRAFEFKRLPPGVYYLAAWEDGDPGLIGSRDFLAKFLDKAAKLEIAEGAQNAVEAPLISVEAYNTEEAKLQ